MKINERQKQTLAKWIAKNQLGKCSCGSSNFTFIDRIYEIREYSGGNLVLGGDNSVLPAVVFVCGNCGELKMLSAIMLGVLSNEEKEVIRDDKEQER